MRPADNLCRRRHVLFTMLTALEYRYPCANEPALIAALRTWLHGWPGIGRIVAGMSRQGHDLQLTRHGAEGWRATFYPAGRAHSQTAAVGSAWAPEPWTAVQQAAWEGLQVGARVIDGPKRRAHGPKDEKGFRPGQSGNPRGEARGPVGRRIGPPSAESRYMVCTHARDRG